MFDSEYYIIDGQHRYHSLLNLFKNNLREDIQVRFDILIVLDDSEIRNEFVNINKSVPVPFHYLTPNNIINLAVEQITRDYPKCFTSNKARRPMINVDVFKDTILNQKIIEKFNIVSYEELINLIYKLNSEYERTGLGKLQDIIARKNQSQRVIVSNCFEKCKTKDFLFLGLFEGSNWINDMH